MANAMYDKGREKFLNADIDWSADNIKCILVDTGSYTVDLANHEFLSDVAGGAIIATSSNLASKTSTAGVADAADVTLSSVTGAQCEAIIFYKDTGVAGTSPLFLYIDTATGLPITPNGADITLQFDSGANKIFKL